MGGAYRQPELLKAPGKVPVEGAPESGGVEVAGSKENSAPPAQAAPAMPMPQVPVLPPPQAITPSSPPDTTSNSNPLVAADEEVLEKEWVDRAKKVVNQTKDDPYAQEKEVSKLQADYLKKRYGKDIKLIDE